jgi:hypothetical protein
LCSLKFPSVLGLCSFPILQRVVLYSVCWGHLYCILELFVPYPCPIPQYRSCIRSRDGSNGRAVSDDVLDGLYTAKSVNDVHDGLDDCHDRGVHNGGNWFVVL